MHSQDIKIPVDGQEVVHSRKESVAVSNDIATTILHSMVHAVFHSVQKGYT